MAMSFEVPDALDLCTQGKEAPVRQPKETPYLCPFTILVDTAEGQPWTFTGLRADARHDYRPIIVHLEQECLGRYPNSLGDYGIQGWKGRCHIERKSISDAHNTILGWGARRDRFESELANLSAIELGIVVVEATFEDLVASTPATPQRCAADNQKAVARSIMSWQRQFDCQWMFLNGRRAAEEYAFWQLRGFWDEHREKKTRVAKESDHVL